MALLLDGTVQDDGNVIQRSRVQLDDPVRHAILWSASIDGPAATGDRLQASIANTVVAVLACSNRALAPVHGLDRSRSPDPLCLHACDLLTGGGTGERAFAVLAALREISAKAPGFVPAHSDFAKFASLFWSSMPPRPGGGATPGSRSGSAQGPRSGPQIARCLSGSVATFAADGLGGAGKTSAPGRGG